MNTITKILYPAVAIFALTFGMQPASRAVSPPPDGGYSGGNTAEGQTALFNLTTGGFNTAVGFVSLRSNTEGNLNTAIGAGTLLANTADENTATGAGSLLNNTTGTQNTAIGAFTLFSNTEGSVNTAAGDQALFNNTTGFKNIAIGVDALRNNTIGERNTAIGFQALSNNTSGIGNVALGNTAGSGVTTGNANIDIGHPGFPESNTIRIGFTQTKTIIAGIRGVTTGTFNAIPVLIDSNNQLGTVSSSRRFKQEIKPMDRTSEAILALKPVSFHYKNDSKGTPQFGLIAEEVAEVNPDLVVRDEHDEIYTVRYDAVNAMLLNEFLKEHRKNEQQEATIACLQTQVAALAAGLQKVNAKLEVSSSAEQTVVNNH